MLHRDGREYANEREVKDGDATCLLLECLISFNDTLNDY